MVSHIDSDTNLCLVTNENGDQFPDYVYNWTPMPDAVVNERQQIVSEYECERWRAMSDELLGQVQRLKHIGRSDATRAEWQAIGLLESAQGHLFGAFGAIMMERHRGDS
jgi:hypothetical protein